MKELAVIASLRIFQIGHVFEREGRVDVDVRQRDRCIV